MGPEESPRTRMKGTPGRYIGVQRCPDEKHCLFQIGQPCVRVGATRRAEEGTELDGIIASAVNAEANVRIECYSPTISFDGIHG